MAPKAPVHPTENTPSRFPDSTDPVVINIVGPEVRLAADAPVWARIPEEVNPVVTGIARICTGKQYGIFAVVAPALLIKPAPLPIIPNAAKPWLYT